MSNATDKTSCISHRATSRFFVMYEDFLEVAKVSEHQYKLAAFWRVLETKTNERMVYNQELIEECKKKGLPEPETNLWIEITYTECTNRVLGVYKGSSFQIAAAESERLGFTKSRVLKRHRNPLDLNSPIEDYKEYLFLTDVMQTVLNTGKYPTPIDFNSPLLKSIATRKQKRAIEKNGRAIDFNTTPVLKKTGGAIEINRKKNSKESTKYNSMEESVTAIADDTTASSSFAKGDDDDNGAIHRGTDATGSSRMVREISDQHLQHASGDTLTVGGNQQQTSNTPSIETGDDDGNNGANNAPHRPDHHSSVNGVTVPVDIRHSEEVNGQSTSTVESSQLNRLTNPPEPPVKQNVSTDESSFRIERETANDTASLPVIEPTTDEVIRVDARNDGNSYSPQSTSQTPTPETEQQAAAPATGKGKGSGGTRKPKAPEDPTLKVRVERVYKFFDKLAQDITGVKDFHYQSTGVSDKAIKNWLKGNPTEELLRDVFAELWNSPPDPRTGFSWQDHMKIPTILKEYDSRVLAIQARRRKQQQQASGIITTASKIAGYTMKADTDDDDFVYESKAEKTQRKRA